MPSIASILDPKLTTIHTRLTDVQTKLHAEGAFPGMTQELAALAEEMRQLSGLAALLVIEVRGGLSKTTP